MNGASNKITKPAAPGTIMPRRITPPPAGGSKSKVPGTPMPGPKRSTTPPDRSLDITRVPGFTNL